MTPIDDPNRVALALPLAAVAAASWRTEIWWRMRHLFVLKLVGTTAFTWLFFVAYFHLLRYPQHPVQVMPLTPLDTLVPFVPQALYAYLTLWIYVGIAPGLQRTFRALVVYGLWVGALCLSGLAIFTVWPTQVPPLTIDVSGFPAFAMLQGVDAAGNACPSMHVAVAIFSALHIERALRESAAPQGLLLVNRIWFVAIALSTLAVRQHVVLDVLAGAALGIVFAVPSLRWRPDIMPLHRITPTP